MQAFYLNKSTDAIALLEETIAMPQLSAPTQADCKLELADILLMTGNVWDASLLYSQVEKANKYDIVGQEEKSEMHAYPITQEILVGHKHNWMF